MISRASLILPLMLATSCGTYLPVETRIPPARAISASEIRTYPKGQLSQVPTIARTLGPVEGHSCKNKFWDKASQELALEQVKLRALDLGANGVVEVEYNRAGTELATNCWSSFTASGVAVIFEQ